MKVYRSSSEDVAEHWVKICKLIKLIFMYSLDHTHNYMWNLVVILVRLKTRHLKLSIHMW
jgi:hypothetical protein